MNTCPCGAPTELFLCQKCEQAIEQRLNEWTLFTHRIAVARERTRKRRRQLKELKKIKQRPLEFTE